MLQHILCTALHCRREKLIFLIRGLTMNNKIMCISNHGTKPPITAYRLCSIFSRPMQLIAVEQPLDLMTHLQELRLTILGGGGEKCKLNEDTVMFTFIPTTKLSYKFGNFFILIYIRNIFTIKISAISFLTQYFIIALRLIFLIHHALKKKIKINTKV